MGRPKGTTETRQAAAMPAHPPPGDQIWLNYINLFVDTIKLDGRLEAFAEKNGLGPIVAD